MISSGKTAEAELSATKLSSIAFGDDSPEQEYVLDNNSPARVVVKVIKRIQKDRGDRFELIGNLRPFAMVG